MAFTKGMKRPKGAGRKKGVPNKITTESREALMDAFNGLGGTEKLQEWAQENLTDFYKLWGKTVVIKQEHGGDKDNPIKHSVKIEFVDGR